MSEKWHSDKWFVSPWNYNDSATQGLNFAKNIKVHDVTLRDGEQQAGLTFKADDKVRLAEALGEAGVQRIEAGMPVVSKQDEQAIKRIVKLGLDAEIFAFSRCMVDDVKRALDCGVDGIVVEIPSSTHIIEHAYRWPLEKAIETSIKATNYAHEHGLYTVFFPIDSSRAEMDWFLKLINRVSTEGHMDALVAVDTFGALSPHAIPYFVQQLKKNIGDKPVEVHFHDDFGMGAANTIMGLAAGADVIHTTITGVGERAGNCAYEDVALALLTMYGVDLGLNYDKVYGVSKLLRQITGIQVPSNRGIVGDMIYKVESGIIASWWKNCGLKHALELFPIRWDLVGQEEPEVVLGKNSGIDSIAIHLEKLGLSASEDEQLALLQRVKDKAFEKRGLLTGSEFEALSKEVINSAIAS